MIKWIPQAFIASSILHISVIFMLVNFLKAPQRHEREELPLVRILTLVRPPEAPEVKPSVPKAKPRISRPKPPPEPVNLTPATEPVVEPVPEPIAPEPVAEVAPVDATPSAPATTSVQPPIDPVFPASRLKGGLVPLGSNKRPPYPLIAQDRGIEGNVDIQFVVDKSGNVEDIWIAHSSHKFFSETVMKNVRKWRFKPPQIDGKPARVKASQHFDFKLE